MDRHSPAPHPARILIVDDVPANLELLTDTLEVHGYESLPVLSGELALQAARLKPPHLILLDINLPGLSGFELMEQLRAEPQLAAVPVIFVSARGATEDKVKALELGGVDYIAKPFQTEELVARVQTHLELARLRAELAQHNLQLEETVARRTREVASANARLAVLDQAKTDFLQLISHELRTPLNGMFGVAEILLGMVADDPQADKWSVLYQLSRQRIMTLIDDALLLSEINANVDCRAQGLCALAVLVQQALQRAAPLAQSLRVELAPVPTWSRDLVMGVPQHLVRALQSLLETAVKFARAGSVVRLMIHTTPEGIGLIIETEGRCIPPDVLPQFFQLLAFAKTLTSGGDLGLAPPLAERIVTLYGGAVSVENLNPPGIRFTVRLATPADKKADSTSRGVE